eukprot:45033_1
MSNIQKAVIEIDFNNEGELWLTEIVLYIAMLIIWFLLIRMSWFFCFSPDAPRFRQYDSKALKPIKAKAERAARIRRESETTKSTTTTEPNNARVPSASQTRPRPESIQIKPPNNGSPYELSNEEFKLQMCKIHRSLRVCFIVSLTCTAIYVTSVMLNHTLIIAGAIQRHCVLSKLPVTALLSQRLGLYLFFIFRLHYSFGATIFAVKSIYLWVLIVCIMLTGVSAVFYFFLRIVTAPDPCASGIIFSSGAPALAQDYFWNIFLSVLFISRLKAVVSQQHKGSTRNLERAKLKQARSNYKYYYTMYKLTCLFLTAFLVTVCAAGLMQITGLGAATSAIDSIASNVLLFLNFQFNDHYFRRAFCGCLRLQACCLGSDYAKDMELHFYTNAKKPTHRQSSKTWQEATQNTKTAKMDKIEENKEDDEDEVVSSDSSSSDKSDKGKEMTASDEDKNNQLAIVINKAVDATHNQLKPDKINLLETSRDSTTGSDKDPQLPDTPYDDNDIGDQDTPLVESEDVMTPAPDI